MLNVLLTVILQPKEDFDVVQLLDFCLIFITLFMVSRVFNRLEGLRLLWSLMKSRNNKASRGFSEFYLVTESSF